MKPVYAERRDCLLEALHRYVPQAKAGPAVAGMNVPLHLPRSIGDRGLRARGAEAGLALMPLSRYAGATPMNGLLLGYTALTPAQIRDGARRLAALLG
jgi:GntR family transcriptional regulator/MocR family aminotransferase